MLGFSSASDVYHQNDKSSSGRVLQPVTPPPHVEFVSLTPPGSALRYRGNSVSKEVRA